MTSLKVISQTWRHIMALVMNQYPKHRMLKSECAIGWEDKTRTNSIWIEIQRFHRIVFITWHTNKDCPSRKRLLCKRKPILWKICKCHHKLLEMTKVSISMSKSLTFCQQLACHKGKKSQSGTCESTKDIFSKGNPHSWAVHLQVTSTHKACQTWHQAEMRYIPKTIPVSQDTIRQKV